MKIMVTRIYSKCGPDQKIGLQTFDIEISNVMTSAEIDSIIEKLTTLQVEMTRDSEGFQSRSMKAKSIEAYMQKKGYPFLTHSQKRSYLRKPRILATQVLSDAKLYHTDGANMPHESDQQKSSQPLVPTTLRVFHLVRTEENKFLCLENGRMLPATNQGEIDSDQLAREIAARIW